MSLIKRLKGNESFSAATLAQGIIHISGQVPDPEYTSIEEQTKNVLEKIDKILKELDSNKVALLNANLFIKDLSDFAIVNQIWNEWLGHHPRPARATIQANLVNPNWLIEISATAVQL